MKDIVVRLYSANSLLMMAYPNDIAYLLSISLSAWLVPLHFLHICVIISHFKNGLQIILKAV